MNENKGSFLGLVWRFSKIIIVELYCGVIRACGEEGGVIQALLRKWTYLTSLRNLKDGNLKSGNRPHLSH